MAKVRNALKPVEYWKWKSAILEMQLAKAQLELKENEVKIMAKDIEIAQLKSKVFSGVVVAARQKTADEATNDYFTLKKTLEAAIGQSLDNKVIDELTFEIKDLETE